MGREAILSALIAFNAPIEELKKSLASLSWDSGPVVILTRQHVAAVLEQFAGGGINAHTVEAWANLIECREDIGFEAGHEDVVADAIHLLANPELAGRLETIAPDLLVDIRA